MNLIVGDIFKIKGSFIETIDNALEVVKWFNNHSRALGILWDIQCQLHEQPCSLILPVLTRWTSHFLSVCRLLQLEQAFKHMLAKVPENDLITCAGSWAEMKNKARQVLETLKHFDF